MQNPVLFDVREPQPAIDISCLLLEGNKSVVGVLFLFFTYPVLQMTYLPGMLSSICNLDSSCHICLARLALLELDFFFANSPCYTYSFYLTLSLFRQNAVCHDLETERKRTCNQGPPFSVNDLFKLLRTRELLKLTVNKITKAGIVIYVFDRNYQLYYLFRL